MNNPTPRSTRAARTVRHEISWRSLLSIAALGFGIWLLIRVWPILLIIVVALVLAGTLSPVVDRLEHYRVPRALGLGLILLALVGAVVGLTALIVPAFTDQISAAVDSAPVFRQRLADFMAGIPILAERAQLVRDARPASFLGAVEARALVIAGATAQLLAYSLITIVLAFYLLADHERVQGFFFALLPRTYHLRTARVLLDMETIVGGYVRGQVLTSLLIGIVTFITLAIAGVPNAFALASFAAVVDLLPLVGAILAVIPPALVSLSQGPVVAFWVFIVLLAYNQIENHIIIPRVYGQTMRLSPVAVLIALLVGGQLLGLLGALLALPIAAGIRVLVEDLRIELPGEHTSERTERAADDAAEARYQAETAGATALESAVLANTLAERAQRDEALTLGQVETPIEERGDDGPVEDHEGAGPHSLPNPAR